MSDAALRRTIRRCTALLLVPLSLLPYAFVAWRHSRGDPYVSGLTALVDEICLLVFLGAVVYLAWSGVTAVRAESGREPDPGSGGPGTADGSGADTADADASV